MSLDPEEASSLEEAALAASMTKLQVLVNQAVHSVIPPPHSGVTNLPKERVKAAQRCTGPDLHCHATSTLWRKLSRGCTLQSVTLTTESEYGLRREKKAQIELRRSIVSMLKAESCNVRARYGVSFVVQPGGSVQDAEVTEACDQYGMAMCHTKLRLFHH